MSYFDWVNDVERRLQAEYNERKRAEALAEFEANRQMQRTESVGQPLYSLQDIIGEEPVEIVLEVSHVIDIDPDLEIKMFRMHEQGATDHLIAEHTGYTSSLVRKWRIHHRLKQNRVRKSASRSVV